MSDISKTLLPQMNIKKIFIDRNEIVVNGILTSQDQGDVPFWMDEKYFTEFVDVYFVVDHLNGNSERNLSDPKSRVASYSEATGRSSEDWDFTLINNYDHAIVSLKELTEQEADLLVTDSSIQSSSTAEAGSLKDIAFSVTIDTRKFIPSGARAETDVKLYAFTHLNFRRLLENFNLRNDQQSYLRLQQIGGNFVSERILVSVQDDSANEVYRVPETTTMLVYDDGTPFHGSYHYHGPENPGPGDYIGWMEGPTDPMHPNARTLREIVIPYTKVVANFLLDDDGFEGTGFDGSEEIIPEVRQQFIYDAENINRRALEEFYRTDRRAEALRGEPIIYDAEHFLENEDGVFCATYFSIDFEEIIKTRSRYPFFYERFKTWFGVQEVDLQRNTIVRSFKITRYRLSNSARSNNAVGSPMHDVNSPEDVEQVIIQTSQPENDRYIFPSAPGQFRYGTNLISRRAADDTLSSWYQRSYMLKDRGLSRINFGNYAYNIYMEIDDYVKQLFVEKLESFRDYVENTLSDFLFLASMSRKEYDEQRDAYVYVDGYNFNKNEYTDNFKSYSEANFDTRLGEMIDLFVSLQGLLGIFGPAPNDVSASRINDLKNNIIPNNNGDLNAALNFSKNCDHLLNTLSGILAKDSTFSTAVDSRVNQTVLGQRNSPDKNIKNIEFKARIPGYNTAFNVGDVFVEYGLDSLISQAGEMSARPNVFWQITDSTEEDNASRLLDIREWLSLPADISLRHAANLEAIIRTPGELTADQSVGILGDAPIELPTFNVPGLTYQLDMPDMKTLSADINLNLGNFSSNDIKTPLGKVGSAAALNSNKQFSSGERYKKNQENNKNAVSSMFQSKIFSSLSNKLARGTSSKVKQTGEDLISSKSKRILVKQGKSASASYVAINPGDIKSLGSASSTVVIKVDDRVGQSEGSYRVSAKPMTVTVSQLSSMMSETSEQQEQTQTPSASSRTLGSTTTRRIY